MCDGQLLVKSLQRVVMSMTSYFWHTKIYPYKTNRRDASRRIFEPIIGCQHPIIVSGATPIGSAERAPDRKDELRKLKTKQKFWAYDRLQVPDHSLEGYSHRERWSCTRWRWKYRLLHRSEKPTLSSMANHQIINLTIHSHREGFATKLKKTTRQSWASKQANKAHDKILILRPRS
jgi:hypothetical protein